jgi:leucyl aminopeptidase (aminopeptidase T)
MNVEEEEIPITFDIALEQIELLQLSLLHQSSAQALREYEASAKQQLSARHAKLRKEYEGIRAQEQERRRLANLATLESWCADPALLAEHLQTLGRVASDLRSHTEPGSRYSEMTETFEKWATSAESVLLDEHPTHFVEALPDSWRAVHTALALKLRSLQRDISTLPPIPQNFEPDMTPSLQILMENCSSLVDSSLKELELMTKLQKEVLQRGKERIDEQIDILVSTTDATGDKENWVPVWQSVS